MGGKRLAFCYISFVVLFVLCGWLRADLLPRSVLLPSASVGVTDDAIAAAFNPAGLGVERSINGYYFHTFSGETGGDNAFFISSSGLGFGAEFVNPAYVSFSKYTLSDGIKLSNGLYLGSSYAWFGSDNDDYDRLSSWDIGLLYRPSRLLSIGVVGRNLNRSSFQGIRTKRVCNLSLAFRPYTDRVTFSIDSCLQEDQKIRDAGFRYALECEPIDGIILRGSYDNDRNFDIRFGVGFTQFQVGAYSRYDRDWEHSGGVAYARFSGDGYRTKFQRKHYVLETQPEDLNQLERAKEDKTVDGMILRLKTGGYGIGRIQEMRDALLDFRSSGKKVVCYMELAGNREYYLATACDEIMLNHAGYLLLNGLRSEVTFYKDALDKIGIKAELYRIGKYKSASEMLTRDSMSDAYRESLNSLLDDLYSQMVGDIAEGRSISPVEVRERIDQGPYTAREAMDAGLVDRLIYTDELEEVRKETFGGKTERLSGKAYRSLKHYKYDWAIKPKLAIVYATGTIASGKSVGARECWGRGALGQGEMVEWLPEIMGSETITSAIKKAREDESIKAIVLRIDSGGGSVFASDLIWREVMLAKEEKPLIVSMGGVAASGGYYIACPAKTIVAEPGTITGSIGVISGKFSLRGLYDKLGISKEILKRGENSDIYSLYDGFSDKQWEIIEQHTQEFYVDFVGKVAQGRGMTEETVDSIAQGRVWTGKQAKDNGLVDELGGLSMAVSIAKTSAGLMPDEAVDIVTYPKRFPLWRRFLIDGMSLQSEASTLASLFDAIKAIEGMTNDKILFIIPYAVDYE